MALTINLTQLKRKKKEDGTIPIYVRFTQDRKSRYKSTGIAVKPKYWDSKNQRVRGSHDRPDTLNHKLRKLKRDLEETRDRLFLQNDEVTINQLKKEVSEEDSGGLISYGRKYRKQLDRDNRYWEHRHFGVVLNNLQRFLGSKSVTVDDVDSDFLDEFQHFLLTEGGPEKKDGSRDGNSPNTVRRKLQRLKGMFNQARKSKLIEKDPFEHFDKVKPEPVEKAKLSPKQVDDIKALDLETGSRLWHTRNYFMYSFYNAGIRFGDLCTLTWGDIVDGRLKYAMNKTGGLKSIKQQEPMREILEHYRTDDTEPSDYIFPLLERKYEDGNELRRKISSKNVIINRNLKDLAGEAGISMNVSFHIARHSFANYALKKDLDLYTISKALGHADLKITEQYLKSFDEEKLDEDMEGIFN